MEDEDCPLWGSAEPIVSYDRSGQVFGAVIDHQDRLNYLLNDNDADDAARWRGK